VERKTVDDDEVDEPGRKSSQNGSDVDSTLEETQGEYGSKETTCGKCTYEKSCLNHETNSVSTAVFEAT